ncbi:hypothetical protein H312_01059 [Anncaliia algerae PRA339]|uniref:Uncharacterized protein n=1 Tax=Anncaliia algerae PRA339 TaxID=1288291 RepID=A0A059F3E3_9MICR|nr:hypothetical protein H312_01059 [Anncaliia algerae PRA339]
MNCYNYKYFCLFMIFRCSDEKDEVDIKKKLSDFKEKIKYIKENSGSRFIYNLNNQKLIEPQKTNLLNIISENLKRMVNTRLYHRFTKKDTLKKYFTKSFGNTFMAEIVLKKNMLIRKTNYSKKEKLILMRSKHNFFSEIYEFVGKFSVNIGKIDSISILYEQMSSLEEELCKKYDDCESQNNLNLMTKHLLIRKNGKKNFKTSSKNDNDFIEFKNIINLNEINGNTLVVNKSNIFKEKDFDYINIFYHLVFLHDELNQYLGFHEKKVFNNKVRPLIKKVMVTLMTYEDLCFKLRFKRGKNYVSKSIILMRRLGEVSQDLKKILLGFEGILHLEHSNK